jgi:hypothetical protein
MGKTSLMSHILHHATSLGCATTFLSFQLANDSVLNDLDQLLQWFCREVGKKLKIVDQVDQFWNRPLSPTRKCTKYFSKYLFPQIESPLVLGLDEVDRICQSPLIALDFFGLLRSWSEDSKINNELSKLRLIIVYSTEIYIDTVQSPLSNLGLLADLPELSLKQVEYLARQRGLSWKTMDLEHLIKMVGGHPYLIQVALYYSFKHGISFKQLQNMMINKNNIYTDHLNSLNRLLKQSNLENAARYVFTSNDPVKLGYEIESRLKGLGLVKVQENGILPRCELYKNHFGELYRGNRI